MIKICFPPGCYGHYLAQCLYYFTNLRDGDFYDFSFDATGSSHSWRNNQDGRKKIRAGHREYIANRVFADTINVQETDKVVIILPSSGHWLDYLDNQLVKQNKNDLFSHLDCLFDEAEFQRKFCQQWNWSGNWVDAPRWMLREMFSFMIYDMLADGYGRDRCGFDNALKVNASDFFGEFENILSKLAHDLGLEINVPPQAISNKTQSFIKSQSFHGIQEKCEQWAEASISGSQAPNPAVTFFDEAYIQYFFRCKGFEIQCDGLNDLPINSQSMRELIFKQ